MTLGFGFLKRGIDLFEGKNSRQEDCILAKSQNCDTTVWNCKWCVELWNVVRGLAWNNAEGHYVGTLVCHTKDFSENLKITFILAFFVYPWLKTDPGMLILFNQARGAVREEGDTHLASQISQIRSEGFPDSLVVKNPSANAGDLSSIPGLGRFPWRRKWQSTPVFSPG